MSLGIQSQAFAQGVANRLHQGDGPMKAIDIMLILAIIELLLPIILDCFDPDDGEQVKTYLNARYKAADSGNKYGGYQRSTVRALARRVKAAGRKSGNRVTWLQARQMAIATMEEARVGNSQALSLAIRES
jgi:hypothetical protein